MATLTHTVAGNTGHGSHSRHNAQAGPKQINMIENEDCDIFVELSGWLEYLSISFGDFEPGIFQDDADNSGSENKSFISRLAAKCAATPVHIESQ